MTIPTTCRACPESGEGWTPSGPAAHAGGCEHRDLPERWASEFGGPGTRWRPLRSLDCAPPRWCPLRDKETTP